MRHPSGVSVSIEPLLGWGFPAGGSFTEYENPHFVRETDQAFSWLFEAPREVDWPFQISVVIDPAFEAHDATLLLVEMICGGKRVSGRKLCQAFTVPITNTGDHGRHIYQSWQYLQGDEGKLCYELPLQMPNSVGRETLTSSSNAWQHSYIEANNNTIVINITRGTSHNADGCDRHRKTPETSGYRLRMRSLQTQRLDVDRFTPLEYNGPVLTVEYWNIAREDMGFILAETYQALIEGIDANTEVSGLTSSSTAEDDDSGTISSSSADDDDHVDDDDTTSESTIDEDWRARAYEYDSGDSDEEEIIDQFLQRSGRPRTRKVPNTKPSPVPRPAPYSLQMQRRSDRPKYQPKVADISQVTEREDEEELACHHQETKLKHEAGYEHFKPDTNQPTNLSDQPQKPRPNATGPGTDDDHVPATTGEMSRDAQHAAVKTTTATAVQSTQPHAESLTASTNVRGPDEATSQGTAQLATSKRRLDEGNETKNRKRAKIMLDFEALDIRAQRLELQRQLLELEEQD